MTGETETEIEAARRRLREAKERFDRQERRYAMRALESDAGTASARAQMAELEAELEACREALEKLEGKNPAG